MKEKPGHIVKVPVAVKPAFYNYDGKLESQCTFYESKIGKKQSRGYLLRQTCLIYEIRRLNLSSLIVDTSRQCHEALYAKAHATSLCNPLRFIQSAAVQLPWSITLSQG